MSKASIGILVGFSLMIVVAVGNYVASSDAYCQAQLRRLAEPCPEYVEFMRQMEERRAAESVAAPVDNLATPRP